MDCYQGLCPIGRDDDFRLGRSPHKTLCHLRTSKLLIQGRLLLQEIHTPHSNTAAKRHLISTQVDLWGSVSSILRYWKNPVYSYIQSLFYLQNLINSFIASIFGTVMIIMTTKLPSLSISCQNKNKYKKNYSFFFCCCSSSFSIPPHWIHLFPGFQLFLSS